VAEQLLENGKADHSYIGLAPAEITPQIAQQLGLPNADGVLALSVVQGGPAANAGTRPGDVLLSLEGKKLPPAPPPCDCRLETAVPGI
jgi:S1-C subfamily serine protease